MKITAILIIFMSFLLNFCASNYNVVNYSEIDEGVKNNATLIIKDYETLGMIFVTSTEKIDSDGNHTGSKITFEMLLREAQKLGADDIINIRIDKNVKRNMTEAGETLISSSSMKGITSHVITYNGSCLAIKYK